MTSRPSIGRARIGLLNTMFSASSSRIWAAVGLPASRSLRKGCTAFPLLCSFVCCRGRTCSCFDRVDRVHERFFKHALADGPYHQTQKPSLYVLSVAHHDNINIGCAIGPPLKVVCVAGSASP